MEQLGLEPAPPPSLSPMPWELGLSGRLEALAEVCSGGLQQAERTVSSALLTDCILMAESKPLPCADGDPVAMEALLRDVFAIVVDEAIRKGTSVSEKVGPPPLHLLFLSSELSPVCPWGPHSALHVDKAPIDACHSLLL